MKKLIAFLAAGSLLALTTGCPPAPSTGTGVAPHTTPAGSTGMGEHNNKSGADKTGADKTAGDKAAADKAAADKTAADKAADKQADKTAADKAAADKAAADKAAADKPGASEKTEKGKVEKGNVMVDGKKVDVPASAEVWVNGKKDELKNIKDDSEVTVTMDKDGKVTKVEEKK